MLKVIMTEAKPIIENQSKGLLWLTKVESVTLGYEPKERFEPTPEFQLVLDNTYNAHRPSVGDCFHGMGAFNKIVNCYINFFSRDFSRPFSMRIHSL